MRDLYFYLPSFTNNLDLNLALVKSREMHGEFFYNDIRIASFYGSFPNAIWNGGRCEFGKIDLPRFQDIVGLVNSFGIAIRYTFTNCLIREEHLSDEYCNVLMSLCDNGMNEVLVNSPLLEKYLRSNYPGFKYILSTTTLTRGAAAVNEACEKYDLVVADYRDVKNMRFLLEIVKREKVEILLNESCVFDCMNRSNHYEAISRSQLSLRDSGEERKCIYLKSSRFREAYVPKETLYDVLVPMGYKNFKFRGREMNSEKLLNEYYTYLIKPLYRNAVKKDIESFSTGMTLF